MAKVLDSGEVAEHLRAVTAQPASGLTCFAVHSGSRSAAAATSVAGRGGSRVGPMALVPRFAGTGGGRLDGLSCDVMRLHRGAIPMDALMTQHQASLYALASANTLH